MKRRVVVETLATCALSLVSAVLTFGEASAATEPQCVGLDCGSPGSPRYVPEAHGDVRALSGLDDLRARTDSGFYEVPAPIYQGEVQPRAVVYFSSPGQFGRMPASVRDLRVVRENAALAELGVNALIVVDRGIMRVIPGDVRTSRRRTRARSSQSWHGCPNMYFCLYGSGGWGGGIDYWSGPLYYGTGWHNYAIGGTWNNIASSMVNYRNGDTLLADFHNGNGTRYCARQQSEDSWFGDNDIGDNAVSSVALLGSTPDRC
jgi:hypothetical protein